MDRPPLENPIAASLVYDVSSPSTSISTGGGWFLTFSRNCACAASHVSLKVAAGAPRRFERAASATVSTGVSATGAFSGKNSVAHQETTPAASGRFRSVHRRHFPGGSGGGAGSSA